MEFIATYITLELKVTYLFGPILIWNCFNFFHVIIKQCAFIDMDIKNITMGCPNLVQGDSN